MEHATAELVSYREYARRRGVSPSTISRGVARGTIPTHGGRIDPVEADAALAARRVSRTGSGTVADARRRKLAAQVAVLSDEVTALVRSVVVPEDAMRHYHVFAGEVVTAVCAMAPRVAPLVAGRPDGEAFNALQGVLYAVLQELADRGDRAAQASEREEELEVELACLSETELTERKLRLQGDRLEIQRALRRGELPRAADFSARVFGLARTARDRLLCTPARLGPCVSALPDVAEAERLILRELVDALAPLTWRGFRVHDHVPAALQRHLAGSRG